MLSVLVLVQKDDLSRYLRVKCLGAGAVARVKQDVNSDTVLQVLRKERELKIEGSIAQLPNNYRAVIIAYYLEEKSYQQIALEQGVELKTVESKLYRAKQWMRKYWKEEDF